MRRLGTTLGVCAVLLSGTLTACTKKAEPGAAQPTVGATTTAASPGGAPIAMPSIRPAMVGTGSAYDVGIALPPQATGVHLIKPANTEPIAILTDDGTAGDVRAGDGVFSATVPVTAIGERAAPGPVPGVSITYSLRGTSFVTADAYYEGPRKADLSTARCNFTKSIVEKCASANSTVDMNFNTTAGDYSRCAFAGSVTWGDGSQLDIPSFAGGNRVAVFVGSHTYTRAGVYQLQFSGSSSCGFITGNYTFTFSDPSAFNTCQRRFDRHTGRTYLYSMKPTGPLRRADGKPVDRFSFRADGDNIFVDAAEVPWRLVPEAESMFHQPDWGDFAVWTWLVATFGSGHNLPFKKFVARDNGGGSYEAILMPDGMTSRSPASAADTWTYEQGNWLFTGPGRPTYNYVDYDSRPSVLEPTGFWGHNSADVTPHRSAGDDQYAEPEFWVDPRGGTWRTYRQRLEAAMDKIRLGGYSFSQAATGPVLTRGAEVWHLDPDLVPVIRALDTCKQSGPL